MDDRDMRPGGRQDKMTGFYEDSVSDVTGQTEKGRYTDGAKNASPLDVYEIPENESRYFEGEMDEVPPIDIPDEELYRMDYGSGEKKSSEGSRPRKKRKRRNYLLRIAIVVLIVVLAIVFMRSDYFMVKKIKVYGNHKYTRAYIIKKADIKKKKNIFFETDTSDGEDALLANPYFAEASIERDLPDRIVIRVKERRNAAKIAGNGRYYIIDKDGVVLRRTKRDLKVTLLDGIKTNKTEKGEVISVKNKKFLDRNLKLLRIIRKGDLYFKEIDLTDKILKLYVKDRLYCRGESEDIIRSIENGNLRKVIYDLKKKHVDKGTITVLKNDYISFGTKLR